MRLLATLSLGMLTSHAQTSVSWNGGNGNWSTATDWSGGVVPNNGGSNTYNVSISNGSAETVTLDVGVTISDLTLGTSETLLGIWEQLTHDCERRNIQQQRHTDVRHCRVQ
jgi:hypothetical protein